MDLKAVQTVMHPCIVRITQVYFNKDQNDRDYWYIVRAWPVRGSVEELVGGRVAEKQPLEQEEVVNIFSGVVVGVE